VPDPHGIAADLLHAREAAGMSQHGLARACAEAAGGDAEVWRTKIKRYESGVGDPGLSTAATVAEALGMRLVLEPVRRRRVRA
jgi:transcriptional regulator with XRE-family HTH domain